MFIEIPEENVKAIVEIIDEIDGIICEEHLFPKKDSSNFFKFCTLKGRLNGKAEYFRKIFKEHQKSKGR